MMNHKNLLILTALCLSWPLSPDVLVRIGHQLGENGLLFFVNLLGGATLSFLAAIVIHAPVMDKAGLGQATAVISRGIGRLSAMTVILAGRVGLVLLLSTGMLVSAGFAFNEIFVFWFPNFGFSFVILGCITFLHLLSDSIAKSIQPLFILITAAALLYICGGGLDLSQSQNIIRLSEGITFSPSSFTGALILFLGFDFYLNQQPRVFNLAPLLAIGTVFGIFFIWALVTLLHISPVKLNHHDLPHLLTARIILNDTGRIAMGVAIISGTFGVVNGLMLMANTTLKELADHNLLIGHSGTSFSHRRYLFVLSGLITIFLMAGLAGNAHLELYIEAALLLWLIHISCQCFATARMVQISSRWISYGGYAVSILFSGGAVYLLIAHEQTLFIARFLLIILGATMAASWLWLHGKQHGTVPFSPYTSKTKGGQS